MHLIVIYALITLLPQALAQNLPSEPIPCTEPDGTRKDVDLLLGTQVPSIVRRCIICTCLHQSVNCTLSKDLCPSQPPTLDVQKRLALFEDDTEELKTTVPPRLSPTRRSMTTTKQPSTTQRVKLVRDYLTLPPVPANTPFEEDPEDSDDPDNYEATSEEDNPDSRIQEVDTTTTQPLPKITFKTREKCIEQGFPVEPMTLCPGTAEYDADTRAKFKHAKEVHDRMLFESTSTTESPTTTSTTTTTPQPTYRYTVARYPPYPSARPQWGRTSSSRTVAPVQSTTTTTTPSPTPSLEIKASSSRHDEITKDSPALVIHSDSENSLNDLLPSDKWVELPYKKLRAGTTRISYIEPRAEQVLEPTLLYNSKSDLFSYFLALLACCTIITIVIILRPTLESFAQVRSNASHTQAIRAQSSTDPRFMSGPTSFIYG